MTVKSFDTFEEMMADIEARVEEGLKAAEKHHIKVDDLRQGSHFAYFHTTAGITIFGEVIEDSGDAEDNASIHMARMNGYIYAKCYSTEVPKGELGDTHVTHITHVMTKEDFERARANGWKSIDFTN